MSENACLSWYEILLDKILSAIDNLIATPVNNLIFFLLMKHRDSSPGPDVKHPYPPINNSRYALEYKELFLSGAVFSVIASIVVSFYKKNRDKESTSNYFFFERLFWRIENCDDEDSIRLRTVAHFYNPDISPTVLSIRRMWATLTKNHDFINLEGYLNKKEKDKSKEILIEEIYKKINQRLAIFITEQKKYGKWYVEEKAGEWSIKTPSDYLSIWMEQQEKIQKNTASAHSNKKKKFFSSILNFINSRLDELGRASFAYWIGVFIFYFLPGTALIGGIVWPPILVATLFLVGVWATKIYASSCGNHTKTKINVSDKKNEEKAALELLAAIKKQLLLEALLKQEKKADTLRYEKIKLKERSKKSKLCKEIRKVLSLKRDYRFVKAIFNGFVTGCFIIFFSSWLLSSAVLLIVGCFITLSPVTLGFVGAVVAVLTLSLGLVYGTYSAVQKYKVEMDELLDIETKFLQLQTECGDVEIPDISLRECDRLFRRGTINASKWTLTKQFFKRLWIGAIRFGTGILLLKLLPLGTTLAVLYALHGIMFIPSFYPMLGIMLVGGIIFSVWYIWQYHCESKERQTLRIMDFFLHAPNNLISNQLFSSPIAIEKPNKNNLQHKPHVSNALLDKNESNFRNIYHRSDHRSIPAEEKCQTAKSADRIESLRRFSSDSCLNQPTLDSTQEFFKSTSESCQSKTTVNVSQNFESVKRKRSNTLPCIPLNASRRRKQGIDQSALEELRLHTGNSPLSVGLFKGSSSWHSDSGTISGLSQASLSLVVH